MKVDLHTHTNASDGSLSPEALVELARASGVTLLSVTDHDTAAGCPRAQKAAEKAGLRLFLFDVRPEAIPGRIRSGQADLAIGGLKSGEIRSMLLTPVLEYRQGSEEYAFAAWEDARELRELLAR